MITKFKKNPSGSNYILQGDGFYISYNKDTSGGRFLTELANLISDEERKDGEETALCGKDGIWYILEGDFRKEYRKVFPDYNKCLEVYHKNIAKRSNWSTD